jgi:membrane-associated protein
MDIIYLVKTAGYLGIFAIVFAESGLFFGFFLPGDSLLFTAGLLAAQGYLNIFLLTVLVFFAAVTGDSVGYLFGKKVGPKIFVKEDSLFFSKKHLERARIFFEKHGRMSVVIARFLPAIRTFVPILAGVGEMEYGTFFLYNLIGGALWGIGLTVLGFFLGKSVPNIDAYLVPIVGVIVVASLIPTCIAFFKKTD